MQQYAIYLPNTTEIFKILLGEIFVTESGVVTITEDNNIKAVIPKDYMVILYDGFDH